MGSIMNGLDAEAYDRNYTDGELIRRIISYFRPHAWRMGVVVLAVVINSALGAYLPIFVSDAVDILALTPEQVNLIQIGAFVFILGGLNWMFGLINRWYSAETVGNVVFNMREDAFEAITQRDMSFYDQFSTGKIVSRVTSDTQAFSETVRLTVNLLSQILVVAFLIGYLFTISVTLTWVTLGIAPFIIAIALGFRHIARETVTQSRRILAAVSSHVQETVSGIGVAKKFRKEQMVYNEFLDVNRRSYEINLRTGYVFSSIFPLLNMIAGIGTAIIVYVGVRLAEPAADGVVGVLTVGEWFLFIQAMNLLWFPLTSIASFWSQFQLGLAAGERVFALLDADSKVVQTDSKVLESIDGKIRFENVEFAYDQREYVLQGFSLTIAPGETLALVGHTGSGKSSIGKLIARFYEFQKGHIRIDGHDIRTLDLSAYHQRLGIVTQTPFLFDGTVRENIRYGRADATDAAVEAAAQHVAGGDWLTSLPDGLETEVGERGNNLSMGQKQLVALARVLLQNPSIFILDEATASVDPLTEAMIQDGLDVVLGSGRTAVVIAHRLSTIKNADRIIVLNKGEILEEGTHDKLMASGGHYAHLYDTYFRHQSLEYIEEAGGLPSGD